ncbi:MAG: carboxypeptidase-like regulatory domain-containing protein [Pyrinomonadaceae bacterium]
MAQKLDIGKMRVASPCHIGWDSMVGDDRARFCGSCDRHVFNIVGLNGSEIESLVENTEGRLCVRMYQRADATVLTEDCSVGLRLIRKRVATFAGAALSALLGLVSVGYGQRSSEYCSPKVERIKIDSSSGQVSGTIMDPDLALVPGIKIMLQRKGKLIGATTSDDQGRFSFLNVAPGKKYSLMLEWQQGWEKKTIKKITVNSGENVLQNVCLVPAVPEVVGVFR